MARVIAVCNSRKKGTRKETTAEGVLKENYGLMDDAHADSSTHRQVSLLAIESINKMRYLGFEVSCGNFAENLTTEGIDLARLPVGTIIHIGEKVILEVTQIGKECNTRCAIYRRLGSCIMPEEGIFARVVHGGKVRAGDRIRAQKDTGEG